MPQIACQQPEMTVIGKEYFKFMRVLFKYSQFAWSENLHAEQDGDLKAADRVDSEKGATSTLESQQQNHNSVWDVVS